MILLYFIKKTDKHNYKLNYPFFSTVLLITAHFDSGLWTLLTSIYIVLTYFNVISPLFIYILHISKLLILVNLQGSNSITNKSKNVICNLKRWIEEGARWDSLRSPSHRPKWDGLWCHHGQSQIAIYAFGFACPTLCLSNNSK